MLPEIYIFENYLVFVCHVESRFDTFQGQGDLGDLCDLRVLGVDEEPLNRLEPPNTPKIWIYNEQLGMLPLMIKMNKMKRNEMKCNKITPQEENIPRKNDKFLLPKK